MSRVRTLAAARRAPAPPTPRRILVMAHNHPDLHPGGTEIMAHDLFRAYRAEGHEALFLGATNAIHREPHPGTHFGAIGDAGDELLFWSGHFERFSLSQTDLYGALQDLGSLLREVRPDVIHVHHLLLFGAEFLTLARRLLPECRIVMTLHDYYLICAHDGLMIRRETGERCGEARGSACCGACQPGVPRDRYTLRERFLKTHLRAVDAFVSPSRFLKERFVAWGLAPDLITVLPNGRPAAPAAPHRPADPSGRRVFGYFGNLNPWKGAATLLRAAASLAAAGTPIELRVHGGAPFQSEAFVAELDALFAASGSQVARLGPYRRDEIPALMARVDWVVVPSIWWENAPLVIQEAQLHGRPVIASGIGGMAEAVRDEVDGLHARPGDPADLARVMRRAAEEPGLWERLVAGTVPPPTVEDVASRHLELFERLDLARAA